MWLAIAVLAVAQRDSSSVGYAARFRLWDVTGRPVAVIAYQADAHSTTVGDAGAAVGLSVHQSDVDNRVPTDTTWTETLHPDAPAAISGYLQLPTRDELTDWSLRAVTASGRVMIQAHGSQRAWDGVQTVMSDLVIAPAGAMVWPVGADTLLIPRSNSVHRSTEVHLGHQIRSGSGSRTAHMTLTVTDISDPKHGRVVLRLAWNSTIAGPVTTFDRTIDVTALHPGRYEFTLQANDLSGAGTTVRTADVTITR